MSSNTSSATSGPAPELGSPGQFNRKPTRLRDLKPADAWLDLPPLFEEEEKSVQRMEAFEARLDNQRSSEAPTSKDSLPSGGVLQEPERAAIDRDLLVQKSRARIEKLKDIQAGLEMVYDHLSGAPTNQVLIQLRGLIQSAQSLLTEIYSGQMAMALGMEQVKPLLDHLIAKLDCVQPDKASVLSTLSQQDISLHEALKAPNAVPVMEKAALLALAETIEQVLEAFLAQAEALVGVVEEQPVPRQHQPSLQLLQRAGRSQQQMLAQLRGLHDQLGDLRELMSLRMLKASLVQLRSRSLRELQGIGTIIDSHLPALAPIQNLLKTQQQRLEQTSAPDFLKRKVRYTLAAQIPQTPELPPAIEPMLSEYNEMTDKVVVAFEALTAQSLEKDQTLTLEGELADLDKLLGA